MFIGKERGNKKYIFCLFQLFLNSKGQFRFFCFSPPFAENFCYSKRAEEALGAVQTTIR